MFEKLSIRHLRTLRILHETQSMRETARQVFRSQPAISLQIQHLEEIVGFRLIYHKRGAIVFTKQGELFAKAAGEFERHLEQRIKDLRKVSSTRISFGVTHDLYAACRDQLEEFAEYGIGLSPMTSRDILAAIERGDIDVGVAKSEFPHRDAVQTWLYGLNWAGRNRSEPVVTGAPIHLVLLDAGCFYHHVALKLFEDVHPMAVELTICETWDEIAEALKDGGVTVVSSHWSARIGTWKAQCSLPALPKAVLNLVRSKKSSPAHEWGVGRLNSIISASLEEGGQGIGPAWRSHEIRVHAHSRQGILLP